MESVDSNPTSPSVGDAQPVQAAKTEAEFLELTRELGWADLECVMCGTPCAIVFCSASCRAAYRSALEDRI